MSRSASAYARTGWRPFGSVWRTRFPFPSYSYDVRRPRGSVMRTMRSRASYVVVTAVPSFRISRAGFPSGSYSDRATPPAEAVRRGEEGPFRVARIRRRASERVRGRDHIVRGIVHIVAGIPQGAHGADEAPHRVVLEPLARPGSVPDGPGPGGGV